MPHMPPHSGLLHAVFLSVFSEALPKTVLHRRMGCLVGVHMIASERKTNVGVDLGAARCAAKRKPVVTHRFYASDT